MIARASDELANELAQVDDANVRRRVPLDELSHWRIGGRAAVVVEPATLAAIQQTRAILASRDTPSLVIGSTSNLLFDSAGYDGVLIKIGEKMSGLHRDGDRLAIAAGTSVPDVARAAAGFGMTGIEHIVGIPGTIGGLVTMNGGSQRKYIGAHVTGIEGVDADGAVRSFGADDLQLGYRRSGVERLDLVLTEVRLALTERAPSAVIHDEMDQILADRAAKFPLDLPSCGSTFLSDPAMYATVGPPGRAIEVAGLKGVARGGARISPSHANFIVNEGGATSDDVLELIFDAQTAVRERTGFTLQCEARFVYRTGEVVAADVAARRLFGSGS